LLKELVKFDLDGVYPEIEIVLDCIFNSLAIEAYFVERLFPFSLLWVKLN
jgi:hypothetical protein